MKKTVKKTVGCFTKDKLRELAEQPNVTVMQPTHDIVYEPWSSKRVSECVDRLVLLTRGGTSAEDCIKHADLAEFASKYTVFFKKLTDPAFASDPEHVCTVKRLVALKAMVEEGVLGEVEAQAQSADIALRSLAVRVNPQGQAT